MISSSVRITVAGPLVLGAALLLACSAGEDPDAILLPVVADQTGPIALYGGWAVDGMQMAVEDINAVGGIDGREVRLAVEDGQSSSQFGVTAFRRLQALHDPAAVIVATNTGTVLSCAPIANEASIVLFTPIASGPNVSEAGEFVFRNRVSGHYEATEMARIASERFGLQRIAQLALNNEAGPGYLEAFEGAFSERGGTVTTGLLLDPGKTDFRAQVLEVQAGEPEAVFLALTVKEAATFVKQSVEIGFRPRWLGMTTIQSDELYTIAGDAVHGLVFVAEGGDEEDPRYREFAARYEQRFGSSPPMNALNGYDAVQLLAPLLAAPDATGRSVRAGLAAARLEGVGGVLTFDVNGDANKPLLLMVAGEDGFSRLPD